MKLTGKVVFHKGRRQHNQATLEGVTAIADMLAGKTVRTITNCFLIPSDAGFNRTDAPIDWNWQKLRDYLVGSSLYASIGKQGTDNTFGVMDVATQGISGVSGAQLQCTIYFPANESELPRKIIFALVLVAGGNIEPYTVTGYQELGSEQVMAVLDLRTNPINFTPESNNDFTWTLYISPEQ